jgi:hypothetical protein
LALNICHTAQPPMYTSRYFVQYSAITALGVGFTWDAHCVHTSRIFSGNGAARMRSGS